jgi:hypothetical protein
MGARLSFRPLMAVIWDLGMCRGVVGTAGISIPARPTILSTRRQSSLSCTSAPRSCSWCVRRRSIELFFIKSAVIPDRSVVLTPNARQPNLAEPPKAPPSKRGSAKREPEPPAQRREELILPQNTRQYSNQQPRPPYAQPAQLVYQLAAHGVEQ